MRRVMRAGRPASELMRGGHHVVVRVEELRWFLSLCATQNTRVSAAQLGVDQSSLSRGLARIEGDLGNQLFHREGRRLRINQLGRLFHPHVQRAVGELDAGRRTLLLRAGGQQTLRLGFPHGAGAWFASWLPELLTDGGRMLELMLREGTSRQLQAWLADGLLDAAVITETSSGPELEWSALPAQVLKLAVPARHRLSGGTAVNLEDIAGHPLAGYHRGTDIRDAIDVALSGISAAPTIVLESNDTAALEAVVRGRRALAVVLPTPDRTGSGMVLLDTRPEMVWAVGLAFPPRSSWAPLLRELVGAAPATDRTAARRLRTRPAENG